MEERMIDDEDERLIRLKKTQSGDTDAVDGQSAEQAEDEAEFYLSVPEEEYDEDLVGLTPTQLKRELERRKKLEEAARAEFNRLKEGAQAHLAEGDYEEAEKLFSEAVLYAFSDDETECGLWTARTKDFTDDAPLYDGELEEELRDCGDAAKSLIRERAGERLKAEGERARQEASVLTPVVTQATQKRRQAFAANKAYCFPRLMIFLAVTVLFGVGAAVSASYIVRTMSIAPVVLTAVFGGLALISAAVALVYARKYIAAKRLCRENEELSSTADGARLEALNEKIRLIDEILNG